MRIRPLLLCLGALLLLASCASTGPSASPQGYGVSPADPIRVGGAFQSGAANQRAYLNRLRGPNGEAVTYERLGSCCAFETPNGIEGVGLLDRYEVRYPGLARPVVLYLDFYDAPEGADRAPEGFLLLPERPG